MHTQYYNLVHKTYPTGKHVITTTDFMIKTGFERVVKKTPQKPSESIDNDTAHENKTRSLRRSMQAIYDIVYSWEWEWFVTITFDKQKVNRYNYDQVLKKITKQLDNIKQRRCPNLVYIIVPEPHKDGAWHFHGLFTNTEGMDIIKTEFKDKQRRRVYNVEDLTLGFTTATKVTDTLRAATYVTKYVSKAIEEGHLEEGRQRFMATKNASRVQIEYECLTDIAVQTILSRYGQEKTLQTINVSNVDTEGFKGTTTYYTFDDSRQETRQTS